MTDNAEGTTDYWAAPQTLAEIREAARKCAARTGAPQRIHVHRAGEACADRPHELIERETNQP